MSALGDGCAGPVTDLLAEPVDDGAVRAALAAPAVPAVRAVRAVLDRDDGVRTPLGLLGDGELRYLALALVLLTGPGVLEVDPVGEVPAALQTLTVLADGFDRALDVRQATALAHLAGRMCERGHIRLVGAVSDASRVEGVPGARVVELDA